MRRERGTGMVTAIIDGKKYRVRVGRGKKKDGTLRQKQETVYGTRAFAEWRAEQLYDELGKDVVKNSGYTLEDYYEGVVIPSKTSTTKTNQDGYKYTWKHVPDAWKRSELRELTQTEVQAWVDTLTPGTARSSVRYLRAILRQAYGDGLLKTEPMTYSVHMPKSATPKKIIWDEQDIADALVAVRGMDIEPYMLTMCGSGCRKEEALARDWSDYECELSKKGKVKTCWITIDSAFTETDGEHLTKTSQSYRRVPVTGYVAKRLYEIRGTGAIQVGRAGRLSIGGLRRRWNNLWRAGGKVRKKCVREDGVLLSANVPRITPNAPRHSHITLMSELGIGKQTNHIYHGQRDNDIQSVHYLKRYDKRLLAAAKKTSKVIDSCL